MKEQDIRWKQRFQNFERALKNLSDAVHLSKQRSLSILEEQGLIQSFEFTHELAWNVIKDYFEDQGNTNITGSKDAAREAFQKGLLENGTIWMDMIKSRKESSHTYHEKIAHQIQDKILVHYYPEFLIFQNTFRSKL